MRSPGRLRCCRKQVCTEKLKGRFAACNYLSYIWKNSVLHRSGEGELCLCKASAAHYSCVCSLFIFNDPWKAALLRLPEEAAIPPSRQMLLSGTLSTLTPWDHQTERTGLQRSRAGAVNHFPGPSREKASSHSSYRVLCCLLTKNSSKIFKIQMLFYFSFTLRTRLES